MSKIHVLGSDNNGKYFIVAHISTPVGNNTAGKSWKDVALKVGVLGSSRLIVGVGPGEITQEEMDSILAGDTLELSGSIHLESGGATPSSLDEMVDELITTQKANLQGRYKYYGYTQG